VIETTSTRRDSLLRRAIDSYIVPRNYGGAVIYNYCFSAIAVAITLCVSSKQSYSSENSEVSNRSRERKVPANESSDNMTAFHY
jgi:hypothetical protein